MATHASVELPVIFDLESTPELHARLRAALATPAIAIDGSRVQHIDVAGLQLLCAFVATAAARGVGLEWTVVSPMLVTYVKRLGVERLIQLDGVRQEGLEWF
jgi:anti-anti-sigma regulatory factor